MKPLDHDSRRIIAEGHAADQPDPGTAERIWERISASVGAPLPPTAEAASRTLPSLSSTGPQAIGGIGAKLGIGTTALVVLGAASYLALRSPTPGTSTTARSGLQVPTQLAPRPAEGELPSAPTHGPTGADSERRAPFPARDPTREDQAPAATNLMEETRLLAKAQRALARGAPERARRHLAIHRKRFPSGALAQERDAGWVLILCELGTRAEVDQAREAFLHAWPGSPLIQRVREACR